MQNTKRDFIDTMTASFTAKNLDFVMATNSSGATWTFDLTKKGRAMPEKPIARLLWIVRERGERAGGQITLGGGSPLTTDEEDLTREGAVRIAHRILYNLGFEAQP